MTAEDMVEMVARRHPNIATAVERTGHRLDVVLTIKDSGAVAVTARIQERDGVYLIFIDSTNTYEPFDGGEEFYLGQVRSWFRMAEGLRRGLSSKDALNEALAGSAPEGWSYDGLRQAN